MTAPENKDPAEQDPARPVIDADPEHSLAKVHLDDIREPPDSATAVADPAPDAESPDVAADAAAARRADPDGIEDAEVVAEVATDAVKEVEVAPEPVDAEAAAAAAAGAALASRAAQEPDRPQAARAVPPPSAPPQPARRGAGGAILLLLGGAVAVAAGFAAARYLPQGWPVAVTAAPDPALLSRITAQETALAQLAARLDAVPEPAAGVDPAELAALRDAQAALADRLAAVEAKVAELAARPVATGDGGGDPAAIAALAAEIESLRAEVAAAGRPDPALAEQVAALTEAAAAERAAAEARVEALRLEMEAATAATRARAALLRIQAAIDAGGPLAPALADLSAAGVEVPPALAARAAGVPTLAMLQASFPDAARAALAASVRVDPEADAMGRIAAFLRAQTGARSLTPREGDDPDAILSRAEAALRSGDLEATFAELDALPPEGAAAMAAWRDQAAARQAAIRAVAELAASLGTE